MRKFRSQSLTPFLFVGGELKKVTKKQLQDRINEIIKQLSEMSRDGWKNAKPYDYQPLEEELASLLLVWRLRID